MAGVRNPNTDPWTPERTSEALKLRRQGKSAREIAKIIGGTTRSAVIGKMFRDAPTPKKKVVVSDMMANSPNQGVKTKALRVDVSDPQRLAVRRFSWEAESGA